MTEAVINKGDNVGALRTETYGRDGFRKFVFRKRKMARFHRTGPDRCPSNCRLFVLFFRVGFGRSLCV